MDPIAEAVILGLETAPKLFLAAQQIRAQLSETDQARMDAALNAAKASALDAVKAAEDALQAAAQA